MKTELTACPVSLDPTHPVKKNTLWALTRTDLMLRCVVSGQVERHV
jgi:hypothetical protein